MGERTSRGEEHSHITPGCGEGLNEAGESCSLPRLTAQGAAATIKEEKRQEGKGQVERKAKIFLLF